MMNFCSTFFVHTPRNIYQLLQCEGVNGHGSASAVSLDGSTDAAEVERLLQRPFAHLDEARNGIGPEQRDFNLRFRLNLRRVILRLFCLIFIFFPALKLEVLGCQLLSQEKGVTGIISADSAREGACRRNGLHLLVFISSIDRRCCCLSVDKTFLHGEDPVAEGGVTVGAHGPRHDHSVQTFTDLFVLGHRLDRIERIQELEIVV